VANFIYNAEVLEVHDGDTFTVRVDLGFRVAVTIRARLHGVDAPELGKPGGVEARRYVADAFAASDGAVTIQSFKDQRSFERWVCDVYLPDGSSLAWLLLRDGHAVKE
jgi:micrococcal nuclease